MLGSGLVLGGFSGSRSLGVCHCCPLPEGSLIFSSRFRLRPWTSSGFSHLRTKLATEDGPELDAFAGDCGGLMMSGGMVKGRVSIVGLESLEDAVETY